MKAVLFIELRNDHACQLTRLWSRIADDNLGTGVGNFVFGKMPATCWCAQIIGFDAKYKYKRRFLPYKKDYSQSNSVGSRGVMAVYMLNDNMIYEVKDWKIRYFCTIKDWSIVRITETEVKEWIESHLA